MKISIGADHRGFELKKYLIERFSANEWLDVGTCSLERVDYPTYAQDVCNALLDGRVDAGVLICGSGIGMSIAANRFHGIYAALCWNQEVAQLSREDDGSNVLIFPSDFIGYEQAGEIFDVWIKAQFKGGRYQDRLDMIEKI